MSDQAQARRRPRSAAVAGWSFLVVVSCGRSTNDHLRVPECRTVSGFRGRAETATTYPQFISLDSAVRPSWAAAIAPALPTTATGPPAYAGTPGVRPRASGVAACGNASCSGSMQERPPTSRLLISTEPRASRCGRSEPSARTAPGSLLPTLLGSIRGCRRTLEGEDRHLRPRASWLPLVPLPALADADLQRLRSPAGLAPSRLIGWGGGRRPTSPLAAALASATCVLPRSMAQWTIPTPTTTYVRRWCRGDQGLLVHADLD
jgi:hypothetical protein